MKAYDMSMIIVFINAGYAIMHQIGVFGVAVANRAGGFEGFHWLIEPIFELNSELFEFSINGVMILSVTMALATVVILHTNLVTDRGYAIIIFTLVFYTSIFVAGHTVFANYDTRLPGVELFYTIYIIAATLIFIIGIVQMPLGGQKSHV